MSRMGDYLRRQASKQQSDVDEMTSGRWRVGSFFSGDETIETVERKRGLIARLLGLADAYDRRD